MRSRSERSDWGDLTTTTEDDRDDRSEASSAVLSPQFNMKMRQNGHHESRQNGASPEFDQKEEQIRRQYIVKSRSNGNNNPNIVADGINHGNLLPNGIANSNVQERRIPITPSPKNAGMSTVSPTSTDTTTEDTSPSSKVYVSHKTVFVDSSPEPGQKYELLKPVKKDSMASSERDYAPPRNGVTASNVFKELDEIVDMCKPGKKRGKMSDYWKQDKSAILPKQDIPSGGLNNREPSQQPLQNGVVKSVHNNNNNNNGLIINIERKKRIEIEKLDKLAPVKDDLQDDFDIDIKNIRRGKDNTYTEYFDNLIALIDEATRELSV